jgi:hypothetical protein
MIDKMIPGIKRKLINGLLMLSALTSTAWARPLKSPGRPDTAALKAPDKALVARFAAVCRNLADVPKNYTVAGNMTISNKAHPADNMKQVPFLFCKLGSSFYYQLGTTVTVNEQGLYLFIDRRAKSIILSQQKPVAYDTGWKQFADLGASIRDEHYQASDHRNGENETITLVNEQHVSCKQYAVTFNRHTMRILRLFLRLSNIDDPLNRDKEKTIEVTFLRWSNAADISKYLSPAQVVESAGKGWKTQKAFKQYRLVQM